MQVDEATDSHVPAIKRCTKKLTAMAACFLANNRGDQLKFDSTDVPNELPLQRICAHQVLTWSR